MAEKRSIKVVGADSTAANAATEDSNATTGPKDLEKNTPNVVVAESYSAFSLSKIRFYIAIVTFAGFLGPLSGSIYLPLLPILENAHHGSHQSAAAINGTVSIFMATFALAPLFWASFSDFGGRKILYLISLLIFFIANLLLLFFCTSLNALYPLRFFQAFGGASVMSLGAGTIVDLVPPKDRAFALSIFMLGPQVGPCLGPLLGGIISQYVSYRYIFALLALLTLIVYGLIFFCLPETLRFLVGNGSVYRCCKWPAKPKLRQKPLVNDEAKYPRPPKPSIRAYINLLKYVPTFLICFDNALLFGGYYAFTVDFARTLEKKYHYNHIQIGAAFVAPAVGMILGSLISGKLSDILRARFVKANDGKEALVTPERRIHSQVFGVLLSMVGFLLYGWFTRYNIHVAAVLVSTVLVGFGMTWVFATSSAYLTECAPGQAASLVAVNGVFRNAAAAISSAVEGPVVSEIGTGWTFTIVGIMYLVVLGIIVYLITTGASWRRKKMQRPG